jgi:hypothetical protein
MYCTLHLQARLAITKIQIETQLMFHMGYKNVWRNICICMGFGLWTDFEIRINIHV